MTRLKRVKLSPRAKSVRIGDLFDVEDFQTGEGTVGHAVSVDRFRVALVAVAAETDDGVPDRRFGDVLPV